MAQNARLTIPINEMIKKYGDKHSQRLFLKDDYISFILNRYCSNEK